MTLHQKLAAQLFARGERDAEVTRQCEQAIQEVSRAVAGLLDSPDDALRHCRLKPGSHGLPPSFGERLGDVRRFPPPPPIYNHADACYNFALEWEFDQPGGESYYAARFRIDFADGVFTLGYYSRKTHRFTLKAPEVRAAAEFLIAELQEGFADRRDPGRIGFTSE